MKRKPRIALTMGDPAGIGPETVLRAALSREVRSRCRLLVFGDEAVLKRTARACGLSFSSAFNGREGDLNSAVILVDFKNVSMKGFRFGRATAANGRSAGAYIETAVSAARLGIVDAIVTAPINKVGFMKGGSRFVGHTEMLAALTRSRSVALMLAHGPLRAVHVTSHMALRDVPRALSVKRIRETIQLAHDAVKTVGIKKPRIAVCGLNPHAGDDGVLGVEEHRFIVPAVKAARKSGLRVEGPLSPDVVWPMVKSGRFDIGVAMYHDQGQIAVKLAGFNEKKGAPGGVNITLGLPIIRTSPAHGTAYDIAGQGKAAADSLIEALGMAVTISKVNKGAIA